MKTILILALMILSFQALAAGDAENGKKIAYTCTGCHGIPFYQNTYPRYHVPRLGGQNEAYIQLALKAYRSGERSHPTMQAQAGNLTDQDIADIAAYFNTFNK
ncbi:c-type cytochrome [Marinicella litoralis]|uniref:Cytochrome c553 n=1 Tax=Marinicella litoralis TaxID=644220 RepID=A0A4R6XJX2_9GAMM|nr:cytochrome c [Marinicella litoralis]TDR17543.1 cytochrome c553 [Marinicella litoralis]